MIGFLFGLSGPFLNEAIGVKLGRLFELYLSKLSLGYYVLSNERGRFNERVFGQTNVYRRAMCLLYREFAETFSSLTWVFSAMTSPGRMLPAGRGSVSSLSVTRKRWNFRSVNAMSYFNSITVGATSE